MSINYAVMNWSNGGNIQSDFLVDTNWLNFSSVFTYTLQTASSNFSMNTNGQIKYTGLTSLPTFVSAQYGLISGNGSICLGLSLYKNGVQISDSIVYDPIKPLLLPIPITFSNGDYIELYGNATSSVYLEVVQVQMSVGNFSTL